MIGPIRARALLSVLLVAAVLAGCGEDKNTPPAADAKPQAAALDGAALFLDTCATCHEGAVLKAPHTEMLKLMAPENIYAAITNGVMRAEAAKLTDAERRAVAEYLTGRKIGEGTVDLAAAQCPAERAGFDYDKLPAAGGWGITPDNRRYIADSTITPANVQKLKLQWVFAYPGANRSRSQPSFAGGSLYVGSQDGTVFALEEKTGCIRWTYKASADVRNYVSVAPWSRGDKTARPLAYFGDLLGNVYAVEAATGKLAWKIRASDHPNATITAAPVLKGDRLYVSISSLEVTSAADPAYACCTFRGSVAALDAATGARVWETYTIADAPKPVGKTSVGTDILGPSGAPVWNSVSIDEKRGLLFFGTGENYSSPATATSDAVHALDLATGAHRWVRQTTPHDAWNVGCMSENRANCPAEDGPDFDFAAGTILAAGPGGRDLVIAGQKSGAVYGLDRMTGKVLWENKVGRGGIQGGVHFSMAMGDGRLYVPISDMEDGKTYKEEARPGLYALDPVTGRTLWKMPAADVCRDRAFCHPGISAAITAVPGMVLAGAMDGHMRAYEAKTGKILWDYDTAQSYAQTVLGNPGQGGSIGGGAGPVVHDGRLYVSSGYGIYFHMPGNVLLVFAPAEQ